MELRKSGLNLFMVFLVSVKCDLCPKQCDCDMDNRLNRATCEDQNIISIEVGVPTAVQVYSLSRNAISELDNFCFKEAGYISLRVLNLSYNAIFWIGLHAFAGLEELFHLDLSNNRLRYISSDLLWDTPQMTSLDLSSNIFESLRNEPFLMHTKMQTLNLNNCRMKALPERMFSRLPNLKNLDISENYVITLDLKMLIPLRKLERLELRNDYLKCNDEFISLETWIVSKGITYRKYCKKNISKMSEKMISIVTPEKEDVDVNQVWNVTLPTNVSVPPTKPKVPTSFEKFDRDFSSVQAFILGVEMGLAIGVIGTYIWLRKFCKCGQLNCIRPRSRRERRARRRDGDMRTNLLWSNVISPDSETPPSFRRQLSLPDGSMHAPTYGLQVARQAGLHVDAIRLPDPAEPLPDRAETPPPPYNECRINI